MSFKFKKVLNVWKVFHSKAQMTRKFSRDLSLFLWINFQLIPWTVNQKRSHNLCLEVLYHQSYLHRSEPVWRYNVHRYHNSSILWSRSGISKEKFHIVRHLVRSLNCEMIWIHLLSVHRVPDRWGSDKKRENDTMSSRKAEDVGGDGREEKKKVRIVYRNWLQ